MRVATDTLTMCRFEMKIAVTAIEVQLADDITPSDFSVDAYGESLQIDVTTDTATPQARWRLSCVPLSAGSPARLPRGAQFFWVSCNSPFGFQPRLRLAVERLSEATTAAKAA